MSQKTLDKNQYFFIKSLSDRINDRQTENVSEIDWNVVFRYAAIHRVEGMVFLQTRFILPKEYQAKFGANALLQFNDSKKKSVALEKIERAFSELDIPFLIVKGLEVAKYYREIKERAMGDIDLVVKSKDKSRAAETLIQLGYKQKSVGFYDWKFEDSSILIELHDHLRYENVTSKEQLNYTENVWNYASNNSGTSRYSLDWNFHLIFLITHLQGHIENGGAGFRLFIDLVAVCKNVTLDLERLKKDLERMNLLKFASTCFGFCERWFDVVMPFSSEIDEDFFISTTEKIINGGVFGSAEDNMDNYVISRMNDKGRMGAIVNRYFPPIKYLKNDPRFRYLEKWPILLLHAWIKRDLDAIIAGKLSGERTRFSKFFEIGTQIEERNNYLSKWGLDK